jgi:predicted SprT family Zn-dependent metalloprotease
MNLNDAKAIALALMLRHGLRDWRFEWDRSSRRFGVCKFGSKVIGLSHKLVALNDEPKVRDTILHEIAHALCPVREGHGRIWKQKAIEVGAKPERCYKAADVTTPHAPYLGTCPCGLVNLKRHRRLKGRICRKCRAPVAWRRN